MSSGYSTAPVPRGPREQRLLRVPPKPYVLDDVAEAIKKALGLPRAGADLFRPYTAADCAGARHPHPARPQTARAHDTHTPHGRRLRGARHPHPARPQTARGARHPHFARPQTAPGPTAAPRTAADCAGRATPAPTRWQRTRVGRPVCFSRLRTGEPDEHPGCGRRRTAGRRRAVDPAVRGEVGAILSSSTSFKLR